MKENLKDILSNLNAEVDQATLLKYLQGQLTPEEQHEVEKHAMDDAFEADALEGLEDFTNKAKIAALVEQLNQDLKKKTEKKNKWAHKREAKIDPWLLIAIIIILAIAIISFIIIYKLQQR